MSYDQYPYIKSDEIKFETLEDYQQEYRDLKNKPDTEQNRVQKKHLEGMIYTLMVKR